jgi:serine protease Do
VSGLLAADAPAYLAWIADRLREMTVEVSGPGGGGAGVLWAPDLIVTNAHVARAPRVRVGFADDRQVEASLIASDRRADLALLRVPPVEITPAASTDSDTLRVGALVVAVGHPLGLRRTLTAGVVHGFPQTRMGSRWIQADLRLAPGNSGGPLADTTGRVVGINTMIAGGLALAIPINDVRRFVAARAVAVT